MAKPKISVIIPIYNTEKYLKKCIDSVLSQVYDNLEIILVNDGSTDGSAAIIDEYARRDARVIAIHKENAGVSIARNEGIQKATGDFIGFIDSDDWIESDMYQEMAKVIAAGEIDIVICGYFKDTEDASEKVTNEEKVSDVVFERDELLRYVFYRDSYRGVAAYPWNKLFRRDLIVDNQIYFDSSYRVGEDVLWFTEVMMKAERMRYVEKPLYHYLQRSDSAFHSKDVYKRVDSVRAYQKVIELLEGHLVADDILVYVKRFLAYHALNIAKIAWEQKQKSVLKYMQEVMEKYKNEYTETNKKYPGRVEEFMRVLTYSIV